MKLILLRHALQEADGLDPGLSEQGRNLLKKTCDQLHALGLVPSVVYTSPAKRAIESGHMVAGEESVLHVEGSLDGSTFNGAALLDLIEQAGTIGTGSLCFVGHSPTLIEFAQSLVPTEHIQDIRRSCALVLDVDFSPTRFHIDRLISPK